MAETETATYSTPLLTGRKPLYTSVPKSEINETNIPAILQGVALRHRQNVREINILLDVFLGEQYILQRPRDFATNNINNRVVVNRASETVRKTVGYFLGEPISYTNRSADGESTAVDDLNIFMDERGKSARDQEIGEWAAICGTAFRLVSTAKDASDKSPSAPFLIPKCDPRNTGVIYEADVFEEPAVGFTYSPVFDNLGVILGYKYWVYTDTEQYVFTSQGTEPFMGELIAEQQNIATRIIQFFQSPLSKLNNWTKEVPIVEYRNNQWRVGDFEKVLGLMEALNKTLSDRVNAIEQTVGSILVYIDCEPDASGTVALKQKGSVAIKTNGNGNTKLEFISPELSQADAQILESTINEYIDAVTGIPSRSMRSGGGGDTGDAVYLRDGYEDLELVIRGKELAFGEAERKTLRLVSRIMGRFGKAFNPADVQINFVRNRATNILNKSQAAANFVASKLLADTDIVKLIGVTDQPTEMAARGRKQREAQEAKAQIQLDKQAAQKNVTGAMPVADMKAKPTTDNAKTQ